MEAETNEFEDTNINVTDYLTEDPLNDDIEAFMSFVLKLLKSEEDEDDDEDSGSYGNTMNDLLKMVEFLYKKGITNFKNLIKMAKFKGIFVNNPQHSAKLLNKVIKLFIKSNFNIKEYEKLCNQKISKFSGKTDLLVDSLFEKIKDKIILAKNAKTKLAIDTAKMNIKNIKNNIIKTLKLVKKILKFIKNVSQKMSNLKKSEKIEVIKKKIKNNEKAAIKPKDKDKIDEKLDDIKDNVKKGKVSEKEREIIDFINNKDATKFANYEKSPEAGNKINEAATIVKKEMSEKIETKEIGKKEGIMETESTKKKIVTETEIEMTKPNNENLEEGNKNKKSKEEKTTEIQHSESVNTSQSQTTQTQTQTATASTPEAPNLAEISQSSMESGVSKGPINTKPSEPKKVFNFGADTIKNDNNQKLNRAAGEKPVSNNNNPNKEEQSHVKKFQNKTGGHNTKSFSQGH